MRIHKRAFLIVLILAVCLPYASAQAKLTSPKQEFGFDVGADYQLINYTRALAYFKKLDKESDRMSLVEIGKTTEGRPMVMAIITAPKNFAKLETYKQTAKRLALGQGLSDAQARKLSLDGKAVVWIDGGLHATEVAGSQQLIELIWQMVSRNDADTLRILDQVILLATPVNPDGQELVADWYMREKDPAKRSTGGLPRLYQRYVGHDNNRDYYMVNQLETEVISRQLYIEWHPQFLYNHHQTGPAGTVLFCPPFRDPFFYYYDPLVATGTDLLGLAMHERFLTEGKPGAIMREGASYSTWFNGGLRTAGYFHNVIGILTEIIGNPTPITIPFIPDRMLPRTYYPFPIMPQAWHFRQSIDYLITADYAILDFAARRREEILFNRYVMARNNIAKGSRDNWTFQPQGIADLQAQIEKDRAQAQPAAGQPAAGAPGGGQRGGGAAAKYYDVLRDPAKRDPRGFIIPADQPDLPTATKFVNTLIKSGVTVHRATKPFTVAGKSYPAGSFVVKAAQAFRPHIMSMFEPQDHPNDFTYPGGPPRPPYDVTGWTVAFQMGVQFDRILESFDGPFEALAAKAKPAPGAFPADPAKSAGFLLDHRVVDAAAVTNRLHKAGEDVYWMTGAFQANGKTYPAGTIFVPNKPSVVAVLQKAAKDLGVNIESADLKPAGEAYRIKPVRIGVWDSYGGSMDSGWMQWLLTQFEFPFEVVYAPALDAGNLNAKFDVLVFVGGGIPAFGSGGGMRGGGGGGFGQGAQSNIPAEFQSMVGRVSADKTIPILKAFVEGGGAIVAIGSSTSLGYHFGLPVANHMTEKTADDREIPLAREKFYGPGSLLQARVDASHPLAYGMTELTDIFFDNSPVFDLAPEAGIKGLQAVVWFEAKNPLRSGWLWGDQYLWRGVEAVSAPLGKGKLFLLGPEVNFRGQPHASFKLLFNGIFYGPAQSAPLN